MDALPSRLAALSPIDLGALLCVLLGALLGTWRGLGRSFGSLLWIVAVLALARLLTPTVLDWMPNTADGDTPQAHLAVYGALAALGVGLPLLARLLALRAGRDRAERERGYRAFGALVGALALVLLLTAALPYLARLRSLAPRWAGARTPVVAAAVAERSAWLFPPAHREALTALAEQVAPAAGTDRAD